jgi:6-phosphogluconolactonase (cycloisomerase 2 family)
MYVASLLDSNFSGFNVDQNTGALRPIVGSPFLAGTNPSSLAVSPTGKYLYVTNLTSNNISVFTLDSNGLPLEVIGSPFATGRGPGFVLVDPSSLFVYVGNQRENSIWSYEVVAFTGELLSVGTVGTLTSSTTMVLEP